jgi:N-methylhydantoinase A
VPNGEIDDAVVARMIVGFHDEYQSRYGNRFEGFPVEGVTYRVEVVVTSDKVEYPKIEKGEAVEVAPVKMVQLAYMDEANSTVGEHIRGDLKAGNIVRGPAIIREPMSTTHVIAGQVATVGEYGEILIERA